MQPHLEQLVRDPRATLSGFQGRFHNANCPSTAAAVHHFLRQGQRRRATSSLTGGFTCTDPTGESGTIQTFVQRIARGSDGACAVIGAYGGRRPEHYLNIVRLNGVVHFVDAFTRPAIFTDQLNRVGPIAGANRFEFFPEFECRMAA